MARRRATQAAPTPREPAETSAPALVPQASRYLARVVIHAGYGITYQPGDEIPERVAFDGFTEGREYDRADDDRDLG